MDLTIKLLIISAALNLFLTGLVIGLKLTNRTLEAFLQQKVRKRLGLKDEEEHIKQEVAPRVYRRRKVRKKVPLPQETPHEVGVKAIKNKYPWLGK